MEIRYENIKEMIFEESGFPCYFKRNIIHFDNDDVSYFTIYRREIAKMLDNGVDISEILKNLFIDEIPNDGINPTVIRNGKGLIIEKLKKAKLEVWEREYWDNNILDGLQWEFTVKYNNGKTEKYYGSNEFPETYGKLKWLFEKFFKLKRTGILIKFKSYNPYIHNIIAERKKYKDYTAYCPIYKEDIPTGLPEFVLEKNGELEYCHGEEGLKILDYFIKNR